MTAFEIFLYFCIDHMVFTVIAAIAIIGVVASGIALLTLSVLKALKKKKIDNK